MKFKSSRLTAFERKLFRAWKAQNVTTLKKLAKKLGFPLLEDKSKPPARSKRIARNFLEKYYSHIDLCKWLAQGHFVPDANLLRKIGSMI